MRSDKAVELEALALNNKPSRSCSFAYAVAAVALTCVTTACVTALALRQPASEADEYFASVGGGGWDLCSESVDVLGMCRLLNCIIHFDL